MRASGVIFAVVILAASGCAGSTITYTDTTPIEVVAARPAPAPIPARIEVPEPIHFENRSATIRAESLGVIAELAQTINSHPELGRIRVEGHTDIRGNRDFNLRLSEDRAQAVVDKLIENGVRPERLEAQGYGPDRPIADNDTDQGRAQNRRVEFVVLRGEV